MTSLFLILAISLANRIIPVQTRNEAVAPSGVNSLPDSTEAVFALQIQQIRTTSEETAGNNLNVVGPTVPSKSQVQKENFQPISTIYPFEKTSDDGKKYADEDGNVLLLSSGTGNESQHKRQVTLEKDNDINKPLHLVWDNCLETVYRDSRPTEVRTYNDMEGALNLEYENKNFSSPLIKRNSFNSTNSTVVKAWIDKYNSLKNAKSEGRRHQKMDPIPTKKLTTTTTTESTSTTTVQVIPITRTILKEYTEPIDITLDIVTENTMKTSRIDDQPVKKEKTNVKTYDIDDWFEPKNKTNIKFTSLPQTQTYLIPKFHLEDGFHPFGFMSQFFSLICPIEFPIGLIKDIVWGKFTFPYSFLQSIKVESAFLVFIIIFTCIALVIPSYLFILSLLALFSGSRCDDELETGALFPEAEETDCNDRMLGFLTVFVVLICCILISGMIISNEQSHGAAADSRSLMSCACADVDAWLSATARELHHSIVPPIDLVLYAYREDLKNVETLLGEPIQQAISSESGIDLVLDSLTDIISETEDLSLKISSLRDTSIRAGAFATAAGDRVRDLGRQIDSLKKLCTVKDAPLCDTINTHNLELRMKFDSILQEHQLLELRTLGVENLTRAISTARQDFKTLPSAISAQTATAREDVLRDIEFRRQLVHSSSKILSDIVRHLTSGLHSLARQLESGLDRLQEYELWRWTFILACNVIFGFVMFMMLCALLCGCGQAKIHAKRTLQVSSLWLCFVSLVLWSLICAIFLIAGHAEVYVCHALWDSPQYRTLSALLDRPSPFLSDDEGIFDALFREMENITIDVSVKDILRDCENNRPAYIVFQLDKILDVNRETSYFEWEELQADLGRLASAIDVGFLKTVSANFNSLLNQILVISNVNLAKHRMDYNGPVVGKDLPSLIDQLENVAAQVTDLTTAGRLETLATRTQRLYTTNIKPLEQLRADLVFKLTELELQLMPFRRKLNISLSHIHTAQFYINNQGDIIAQKKVSTFVSRLISHAASWRTHVLVSAGKHAGRCRPLFAVYSAIRSLMCSKYVASLHGWWVCGLILGVFWCTALTPLCVKLWRAYHHKLRAQETLSLANLGSGHQGTPATALCVNSNWNTPGPPPPPRSDSW